MPNYPNPCEKCKSKDACTYYTHCQKWLTRYRYRQKQINGYAKIHLPDYEKRRGKIDAAKKQQSPCRTCTRVKDPYNCGNRNCADWKQWYLARQRLINGYAKKNLPDYEQRKKEGIYYDDED